MCFRVHTRGSPRDFVSMDILRSQYTKLNLVPLLYPRNVQVAYMLYADISLPNHSLGE